MPLALFPFSAIVASVIRFEIEVPRKPMRRWGVRLPPFKKVPWYDAQLIAMPVECIVSGICYPWIQLFFILAGPF